MPAIHGRGAEHNPHNRFERLHIVNDAEADALGPRTHFFRDKSKSILSENQSPDLPFRFSVNPYRGCEHGCVYCYARPSHEYLGFSAGLDFESKIMVKHDAAILLRQTLAHRRWRPEPIMFSGNTDCYQPVERRLGLTRACLEVCADFRQPVRLITKSALVRRDIDVLARLAEHHAVSVCLSVTTLDDELAAALEPRASRPRLRLEAIGALAAAGIPTGVMVAPIIAGLNDSEVPAILAAARDAGALVASYTLLRLAPPVDQLFLEWLDAHRPERKDKILGRIRDVRRGKLNQSAFGERFLGDGPYAEQIRQLFAAAKKKLGFADDLPALSNAHFRKSIENPAQLRLF